MKIKIVSYKIFYLLAEKRIVFNFARNRNTRNNFEFCYIFNIYLSRKYIKICIVISCIMLCNF